MAKICFQPALNAMFVATVSNSLQVLISGYLSTSRTLYLSQLCVYAVTEVPPVHAYTWGCADASQWAVCKYEQCAAGNESAAAAPLPHSRHRRPDGARGAGKPHRPLSSPTPPHPGFMAMNPHHYPGRIACTGCFLQHHGTFAIGGLRLMAKGHIQAPI